MVLSYLYTCKDIMCPFRVKARRQSDTAVWNVTQDSLNLAHTCGLTFGNRKAPKHPVLSMAYPQIGLYIPVTSKTGGTTKHLQKTACVQAGIHMKTSQAYACCQDTSTFLFFVLLFHSLLWLCYSMIYISGVCPEKFSRWLIFLVASLVFGLMHCNSCLNVKMDLD